MVGAWGIGDAVVGEFGEVVLEKSAFLEASDRGRQCGADEVDDVVGEASADLELPVEEPARAVREEVRVCDVRVAVQQRLVILLPDSIEEVRDRGFAYARLDYLRPALEDLERYLGDRPDAEDATVVESQLHELRQRTQHNDRD